MALKATICKANVSVADIDRGYYADHALTIARHPSETDERMMMRVLAFALHASDALTFGKGLSADDEPDLWQKDLTGSIQLWIEVGQPDERRVRKACSRAVQVHVYSYGGSTSAIWLTQMHARLERAPNLTVTSVATVSSRALAGLAARNMQLNCTIQEGQVWLANDVTTVQVELAPLNQVRSAAN
jgi:uncharacterized protein YaeQ